MFKADVDKFLGKSVDITSHEGEVLGGWLIYVNTQCATVDWGYGIDLDAIAKIEETTSDPKGKPSEDFFTPTACCGHALGLHHIAAELYHCGGCYTDRRSPVNHVLVRPA